MKNMKKGFTLSKSKGFTLIELPVVRKRAFTLIELLVVIAIIGILATVVILNVANARTKAIDAKAADDLSVITRAIATCSADGGTVASPAAGATVVGAGAICSGSNAGVTSDYPSAASGTWNYVTNNAQVTNAAMGTPFPTASAPNYVSGWYGPALTTATKVIECISGGCTKYP